MVHDVVVPHGERARGVKRFSVNLGRRTQRAVTSEGDDEAKDGGPR